MSPNVLKVIIAGALLLHGIAHGIALAATVAQALSGPPSSRPPVRTWLSGTLNPRSTAIVGLPFWGVSTICFLAACAAFWGLIAPTMWRQLAVLGAAISTLGIALFPATWPGSPDPKRSLLNSAIALGFNIVILASQLWLRWPPSDLFQR
jgi:hypothetical protein